MLTDWTPLRSDKFFNVLRKVTVATTNTTATAAAAAAAVDASDAGGANVARGSTVGKLAVLKEAVRVDFLSAVSIQPCALCSCAPLHCDVATL
jgi:hypothetical protein